MAQRRVIGAKPLSHQVGKAFNKLWRNSAFGIGELPVEHDDVGLHIHELFGQLAVLSGETRVRGGEMALGNKVEKAIDTRLEMRLPGLELPQLLPPCFDRLRGKIEPPREKIAKPLGIEEPMFDRVEDDVVELRPSDSTALAYGDASSCPVGTTVILITPALAGYRRHAAAAAISQLKAEGRYQRDVY